MLPASPMPLFCPLPLANILLTLPNLTQIYCCHKPAFAAKQMRSDYKLRLGQNLGLSIFFNSWLILQGKVWGITHLGVPLFFFSRISFELHFLLSNDETVKRGLQHVLARVPNKSCDSCNPPVINLSIPLCSLPTPSPLSMRVNVFYSIECYKLKHFK